MPQPGSYSPQLGSQMPQLGSPQPQLGSAIPQPGSYIPQLGSGRPQTGSQVQGPSQTGHPCEASCKPAGNGGSYCTGRLLATVTRRSRLTACSSLTTFGLGSGLATFARRADEGFARLVAVGCSLVEDFLRRGRGADVCLTSGFSCASPSKLGRRKFLFADALCTRASPGRWKCRLEFSPRAVAEANA